MARIVGAHSIVYTQDADADRAFFRDVLGLPNADAGDGWLIFGVPAAEFAMHPGEANDEHELYLMVDDIAGFTQQMGQRGVACAAVQDLGWGVLTTIALPGGGKLGVYEPRHARPSAAREGAPAKAGKAAKAGAGKGARRSKARAKPAKAAKPAKGRAKGKPKRRGR